MRTTNQANKHTQENPHSEKKDEEHGKETENSEYCKMENRSRTYY